MFQRNLLPLSSRSHFNPEQENLNAGKNVKKSIKLFHAMEETYSYYSEK
jgi:hypothetical protein